MKKILSVLLCAAMIAAASVVFSACGKNDDKRSDNAGSDVKNVADTDGRDDVITGGWTKADSSEITDELRAKFEAACETLTGEQLTPLSLMETQVVAGMNYRILCESLATVPDAEPEKVVVTLYVDLDGNAEITDVSDYEEENVQIANPVVEYGMDAGSLEAAKEAVGFSIDYPAEIVVENYIVIDGTLLEIAFDGGYIRKAKGSDDISGDYNEYENVTTADAGGRTVTLKGNGDKIMLAIWTAGDYTYCIGVTDGVSEAEMTSYVDAIK